MGRTADLMKSYIFRISAAGICCVLGVAAFLALRDRALINRNAKVLASKKAYEQGQREAEHDLSEGKLKLRVYGAAFESHDADLEAEVLSKEYGIELVRVADRLESDASVEKTCGYNQTSLLVIEKRYGKGLLDTMAQRIAKLRYGSNVP